MKGGLIWRFGFDSGRFTSQINKIIVVYENIFLVVLSTEKFDPLKKILMDNHLKLFPN